MEKKTKKNLTIVLVFTAFIVASVIAFIYVDNMLDEQIAADENATKSLPQSVKEIINDRNASRLLTSEETGDPVTFRKYVFLSYGYIQDTDANYSYRVDAEMNNSLGTTANLSDSGVDGIILYDVIFETVGYYSNNDVVGELISFLKNEENVSEPTGKKAQRICSVLSYVSVPDGVVLKRDTICGGDPPSRIKKTDDQGLGSAPDNSEIIKSIKSVLHN